LFCGPRIGLSDKFPEFWKRDYRFTIFPEKLKKDRKGLHPA